MTRRSLSTIAALALLAGCAPNAAPRVTGLKQGTPESAGFSSTRLARIDSSFSSWIEQGKLAGAVALVIRNGTIVYYRANGYNDLASKAPLEKDMIFRIASQSKAITSVAAMMLYEEGKFLLDDPISKYIPAFAHQTAFSVDAKGDTTIVPVKKDATIRQLLMHTSGLSYPGAVGATYRKEGIDPLHTFGVDPRGERLADVIPRMARVPLMHEPGTRYTYGFSVDVLGYLVEIWSGMSLDEYFRKRIFEPLGMRDTYFNVPEEKAARVAHFFRLDSAGMVSQQKDLVFAPNLPYPDTLHLSFATDRKVYFGGGGGLSSTIMDYAIFLQMMLNGGEYNGVRLLSPSTVRMMTSAQTGDITIDAIGRKFGLGFSVETEASSGHQPAPMGSFAWGGALGTRYWVDPKNKIVALVYRQTWGTDKAAVAERFPILVYQALVD